MDTDTVPEAITQSVKKVVEIIVGIRVSIVTIGVKIRILITEIFLGSVIKYANEIVEIEKSLKINGNKKIA